MSSTAAVRQTRPSLVPDALRKARLRVVPRLRPGRTTARRMPFVGLVSLLLIGGVVGLLIFNTSMQQAAFSQQDLQQRADTLAAKQEALTMQLQHLDDPQNIAAQAQAQGMVIPDTPALLQVSTGKVIGTATPADRLSTPQLWAHTPTPRYAPTVTHKATAKTRASSKSATTNTTTKTTTTTGTTAHRATKQPVRHAAKHHQHGPSVDSTPKKIVASDKSQGD